MKQKLHQTAVIISLQISAGIVKRFEIQIETAASVDQVKHSASCNGKGRDARPAGQRCKCYDLTLQLMPVFRHAASEVKVDIDQLIHQNTAVLIEKQCLFTVITGSLVLRQDHPMFRDRIRNAGGIIQDQLTSPGLPYPDLHITALPGQSTGKCSSKGIIPDADCNTNGFHSDSPLFRPCHLFPFKDSMRNIRCQP